MGSTQTARYCNLCDAGNTMAGGIFIAAGAVRWRETLDHVARQSSAATAELWSADARPSRVIRRRQVDHRWRL